MTMSRIAYLVLPALALMAGCKTTTLKKPAVQPAAVVQPLPAVTTNTPAAVTQPSPKAARRQAEREAEQYRDEVRRLEKTVAGQRETQEKLNAKIRAVQQQIQQAQEELQRLQGGTLDSDVRLARNETALQKLKDNSGLPEGAAGREAALKKTIAEEQRKVSTQEILLEQKEREIRDLREAISARDEQLKQKTPVAEPPSVVTNAPALAVTPKPTPVPPAVVSTAVPPRVVAARLVTDGQQLVKEGKLAAAEDCFTRALALNPKLDDARFGFASCRYATGDVAGAKKALDELLKRNKRHGPALGLAGIIALKQNDLRTARDRFEHAVKRSPKDARLHTNLAIVYDGMRKKKAALRELRKAVALDPNLAEARFNLAILLVSEKPPKLTEAKHHYQTALQLGSTRDERLEKILYQ